MVDQDVGPLSHEVRCAVLAFTLLGSLDRSIGDLSGVDSPTVEETKAHIEDGTLWPWLESTWPRMDLSLFGTVDRDEVIETFQRYANAIDEEQAFLLTFNGRLLLAAYCIDVMKDSQDDDEGES
jgi:hypothetical protein